MSGDTSSEHPSFIGEFGGVHRLCAFGLHPVDAASTCAFGPYGRPGPWRVRGLRLYGGLDEFAFGPREAKSTIKWKTLAQFMR